MLISNVSVQIDYLSTLYLIEDIADSMTAVKRLMGYSNKERAY
jgi:hypothetical protein